jgi:hypothetical protein
VSSIRSAYRGQATTPPDRVIADRAAQRFGVVSRAELLDAGVGPDAIDRRLRSGRLRPLHRGVYADGHGPLSREGRWCAAILACGPGAVLSHRDAAEAHGLRPCNRTRTEVTTASRRRRSGIEVHECRLEARDVTTHRGIPVTTPARTLLDLADVVPADHLARAIERAHELRVYDHRAILDVLARSNGRRGVTPLTRAIAEYDPDRARTKSQLERVALPILAGLPRPEVNTFVAGHEVDLVWRAQRLVVELDSRTFHTSPRAFEQDRVRDADLQLEGYRVIRLTWRRLRDEPDRVRALVASLLTVS